METDAMINSETTSLSRSEDDPDLHGCFSPKKITYRFVGLALMCFMGFGSYFCYDNPAALQDNFKNDLNMPTKQFVLLYSIYSWPNVILCFVGGFLLDRIFGIRWGSIIYMCLTLLGQLIFSLGAYQNLFWLMMLGRFIFGIGGESLAVAQNSYAVLWFKGKELNMVFGLQLSFARVGSVVNFLVMENIYGFVTKTLGHTGPSSIGVTLLIAASTCLLSLMSVIVLGLMDSQAEKFSKRNENQEPQLVKLSDIKSFKSIFWLITWICVAYYMAIFPFISLGKLYFIRKYDYEPSAANTVNSLLYSISAIASPLFGLLVDKSGRNILWVMVGIIGSLMAHGSLAFTYMSPYLCMILLGLSYSLLASSLWPLIALVTCEYQLGTAYGIAQAMQNFGLAVTSIVSGLIVDTHGYLMLELFFLAWLWISFITAITIYILDINQTGGYLNMSPNQRQMYENITRVQEVTEREQLLARGASTSDLSSDDVQQFSWNKSNQDENYPDVSNDVEEET